jgi:tetratricopeptide (TPR) repeat protein
MRCARKRSLDSSFPRKRGSSVFVAGLCAAALLAGCAAPAKKPVTRKPAPTQASAATPAPAARPPAAAQPAPTGAYADALKLLKANQLEQAEAALQAVAKANPQASGPLTNLGIVYARTNRKPEARTAFTRAINLNPANAAAHNWLGVLAREAGDFARAEQAYQAALAADADYAAAQLNLAILYDLHLKRPADALAAYRKYEALTGRKDARVAVWIGELEASSGTTPQARPMAKPGGTQS